eukprot:293238_1
MTYKKQADEMILSIQRLSSINTEITIDDLRNIIQNNPIEQSNIVVDGPPIITIQKNTQQKKIDPKKIDIGDWLEVKDAKTHEWKSVIVIDKQDSWIAIHFDECPKKYDQTINVTHKCVRMLHELENKSQEIYKEKQTSQQHLTKLLISSRESVFDVNESDRKLLNCFSAILISIRNMNIISKVLRNVDNICNLSTVAKAFFSLIWLECINNNIDKISIAKIRQICKESQQEALFNERGLIESRRMVDNTDIMDN